MTRIGVISDTHGTLDQRAYESLADCDVILHAGDIGNPKILQELRTLAPVHAVLGNNDFDEYGEGVGRFANVVIDGVRVLMAHKPGDIAITAFGSPAIAPGDPIPAIRIHGHTHVPKLLQGEDAYPSKYVMCPGAVFRPREFSKRGIGKIDVADGRIQSIWLETLDGEVVSGKRGPDRA